MGCIGAFNTCRSKCGNSGGGHVGRWVCLVKIFAKQVSHYGFYRDNFRNLGSSSHNDGYVCIFETFPSDPLTSQVNIYLNVGYPRFLWVPVSDHRFPHQIGDFGYAILRQTMRHPCLGTRGRSWKITGQGFYARPQVPLTSWSCLVSLVKMSGGFETKGGTLKSPEVWLFMWGIPRG